jgi:hypothetical protein
LNGTNSKSNLVNLTAREHFIAHALLCYIHPDNNKLLNAFHAMMYLKDRIQKREYKISAKQYQKLKEKYIISILGRPALNKGLDFLSPKAKAAVASSNKRRERFDNFRGRKHSPETKEKMRLAHLKAWEKRKSL